ncbi:MAG: peptidylprolyl isomerase, partial [Muribaculaceae bacterium]|nr:peptidylprolyl isomerase [Muribaculaceae bacterium]
MLAIVAAGAVTLKKSSRKKMNKTENTASASDAFVEFETSEGKIKVRLFGDTPLHRDNFLKLVKEGYYNGVLFHRVISGFMIQTGDPDSKNAPAGKALGVGGPDYPLP